MFGKEAAATLGIDGDLGDKDLTILLKYLARDRKAIATDGKVILMGLFRQLLLIISGGQNHWLHGGCVTDLYGRSRDCIPEVLDRRHWAAAPCT